MIAIVHTSKLLAALPRGLITPKDSLLICKSDEEGRVLITDFAEFQHTSTNTDHSYTTAEHVEN